MEHSSQMRILYQISGIRGKKLLNMFPQYCRATVFKHAKKPINGRIAKDKRTKNRGRPRKLSNYDRRRIIRTVRSLRKNIGHFTSKMTQVDCGQKNTEAPYNTRILEQ